MYGESCKIKIKMKDEIWHLNGGASGNDRSSKKIDQRQKVKECVHTRSERLQWSDNNGRSKNDS